MSAGKRAPLKSKNDRWGFYVGIKQLVEIIPSASTGQQIAVIAMGLLAAIIVPLSVGAPGWAILPMLIVVAVLIVAVAIVVMRLEVSGRAASKCRDVPHYPPSPVALEYLSGALEEVRQDVINLFGERAHDIPPDSLRANIFLLAHMSGGKADGQWRLVIHPALALNMNHPPERDLQFAVGQGATGLSFRDGTYQLTRRLSVVKGHWDLKFQMTDELTELVHSRLRWIITIPLLKAHTRETVGVLNIDGLADVEDDEVLNGIASHIQQKVNGIAEFLCLQSVNCVNTEKLE